MSPVPYPFRISIVTSGHQIDTIYTCINSSAMRQPRAIQGLDAPDSRWSMSLNCFCSSIPGCIQVYLPVSFVNLTAVKWCRRASATRQSVNGADKYTALRHVKQRSPRELQLVISRMYQSSRDIEMTIEAVEQLTNPYRQKSGSIARLKYLEDSLPVHIPSRSRKKCQEE